METQSFFQRNKVLLLGLLGSIGLALSSFVGQAALEPKPLVYAVLTAALSFLANNLRGQWVSIAGILGTSLSTYITMEQTGNISWQQLLLQAVVALIAIVSPSGKSKGYEHTDEIVMAKIKGDKLTRELTQETIDG